MENNTANSLLENINKPSDVKALDDAQLAALCDEIRKKMIET